MTAHDSDGQSEGGATHSGYVSGYTSADEPDYDEVRSLFLPLVHFF